MPSCLIFAFSDIFVKKNREKSCDGFVFALGIPFGILIIVINCIIFCNFCQEKKSARQDHAREEQRMSRIYTICRICKRRQEKSRKIQEQDLQDLQD